MKSLGICFAFLCLAGLLAAPPALCLPWFLSGRIVLPFGIYRGLIVTGMSLNGKPGQNFIIDTGCTTTLYNPSAVHAEGLRTVPRHVPVQSLAGDFTVDSVVPHATIFGYGLRIGGGGPVVDLQAVQHYLGIRLTGIIGADTITSRPILLDYQTRKITMFLRKRMPHFSGGSKIRLEPPPPGAERFSRPVIRATLELPSGKLVKLKLTIDTGSVDGLSLHEPFAKKYGLLPVGPKRTVKQLGLGGAGYRDVPVSVPALFLGSQKIVNPSTFCDTKAIGVAGSTKTDGEIGYKILSRFRVFIDSPRRFVIFEPVARS